MRILFLHGWQSVVGGRKPSYLKAAGNTVINPALDHDDFQKALHTAQSAFDQQPPDVIVGSSRGGAVAMNLDRQSTPLVLLCPAWKKWGEAKTLTPPCLVLHSRSDEVIPFSDSEQLIGFSRLPLATLIPIGSDHRLADPDSLQTMLESCRLLAPLAD